MPPHLRGAGATSLFVLRDYYDSELRWMAKMLSKGMVVVDGGANIGAYAMVASNNVGATGRVLAFEPGRESFSYLSRNAEMCEPRNVSVFRLALSDAPGESRLFHTDGAPNSYSLAACGSDFELVPTTTLDLIAEAEGLQRLDFLKLDVEGAEELVLRGARLMLTRFNPVVLFESNPRQAAALGCKGEGAWEVLASHGYCLFRLGSRADLIPINMPCEGNNIALPRFATQPTHPAFRPSGVRTAGTTTSTRGSRQGPS